jgi:membrane protease YdiL (CAAX protease family)
MKLTSISILPILLGIPAARRGGPHGLMRQFQMISRVDVRWVWFGKTGGLRLGWALLLYAAVLALAGVIFLKTLPPIFVGVKHALGVGPTPVTTGAKAPEGLLLAQVIIFLSALCASLAMKRIDPQTATDAWLPSLRSLGSRFWVGALWGGGIVVCYMLPLATINAYHVSHLAITGMHIASYTALWIAIAVLNGLAENLAVLGYPLARLSRSTGFWPAAVLLTLLFVLGHVGNPGETVVGLCSIGLQVLLLCAAFKFTGSFWFACGVHAGGIFVEDFLFSLPDSGVLYGGHLLNASLTGPQWLVGGSAGPEGSVFALITFGASIGVIAWFYKPPSRPPTHGRTTVP